MKLYICIFTIIFLYVNESMAQVCKTCKGEGVVTKTMIRYQERKCQQCEKGYIPCPQCNGSVVPNQICSACNNYTRLMCTKKGCRKGIIYVEISQITYLPCTAKKCKGNTKERQGYESLLELSSEKTKKTAQSKGIYQKQRKIIEILRLGARKATIENRWKLFLHRFGKEQILQILGKEEFELLSTIDYLLEVVPPEVKKHITEINKPTKNNK